MVDDDSIIRRLHARDESALDDIRRLYGSLCCQMAYRILENREDAEECVDDMLLAVWNSIPPNLPMSLQAYLITLVRHSAINKAKHESRQKRGNGAFSLALDELAEILPSGEQVESTVERRELMEAMQAFLSALKPETKHVFLQRYYLAESVQTIAKANHMSESAVKVTLFRTRKKLREHLQKEGLL